MGIDALISIGGDDTLKTANKFKLYQEQLPPGTQAHPDRPSAEDDRQRLLGHRLHLRLFHRRRNAGRRNSQSAGRRRSDPQLLHRRDDGPQRRLARLRRRHRRRGQPGDQRRGHHRQVRIARNRRPKTGKTQSVASWTWRKSSDASWPPCACGKRPKARSSACRDRRRTGRVPALQAHRGRSPRRARTHRRAKLNLCRLFADLVSKEYTKQTGRKRKITGLNSATSAAAPGPWPSTLCSAANSASGRIAR